MNADLEKSSSSQSPVPHHSAEQLKTQPQDPPKQRHSITANNTLPAGGEWFSKFMLDYAPSYVLQNKGAVARDHLANERTFLSYLRTSVSMLTVGVAVTQLFRLGGDSTSPNGWEATAGKVMGCIFVAMGFIFITFGMLRYFFAQTLMVKGLFPASRGSVTITGIALMLLTIAIFVATVIMQPPK